MKRNFSIACIIFFFNIPILLAQAKVENLIIYKHFLRAGTTMRLVNACKHPEGFAGIVDTTNINSAISPTDWNLILNAAKKSKHRQTKVGGIAFAGEMVMDDKVHYYILASPNLIVDLTSRINYRINDKSKYLVESYIARLMSIKH